MDNPVLKDMPAMKQLSVVWKDLTGEQRAKYEAMAAEDQQAFESTNGSAAKKKKK